MKSKTSAILLALFLGGFGAHKFYLGKKSQGVLYLLFFWTLIPGILGIIDLITLITKSDESFNAAYNSTAPFASAITINAGDQLEKLAQLKDKGILTQAEFDAQKQKLLS
jgi:TM2 domain-containing membrane protein YozV